MTGAYHTEKLVAFPRRRAVISVARSSLSRELREIVTELWQYKDLVQQLTIRDIRIRYKQTIMGLGWALLMPLVIVLAGLVIRYAMAYVSGGGILMTAVASVAIKALPWAFFVGAIGFATPSLTGNMTLVSKVYFPREALPLSAVFTQSFDTLIGTVILLILLPIFGLPVTIQWLWVLPLGLLLFLFTTGLCLFLSCANLFFRDVKYLVQVAVMFGIFLTPVFYEPIMVGTIGSKLMLLNPLTPILEGLRLSMVEGHNLLEPLTRVGPSGLIWEWSPWYLALSAAWGVLGLLGSAVLFHRSEFLFAERI